VPGGATGPLLAAALCFCQLVSPAGPSAAFRISRSIRAYRVLGKMCHNRRKLLESRHVRLGRPDAARASLAPATLRAYQAGWQAFAEWCQLRGCKPFAWVRPPGFRSARSLSSVRMTMIR
jgi:hypothetical protein